MFEIDRQKNTQLFIDFFFKKKNLIERVSNKKIY